MSPRAERQPLHRTLVTMALAVAATALVVAVAGLVVAETWQYRNRAAGETQMLASVLAENSAAAVLFDDADEARQILASVAVHAAVRRACLYRSGAGLFASYARDGGAPCPPAAAPAVVVDPGRPGGADRDVTAAPSARSTSSAGSPTCGPACSSPAAPAC